MANALEQLQAMAAQQGFAKLTSDVELPVDMSGAMIKLTHVDIVKAWRDGVATDDLKTREVVNEDTGEKVVEVQVRPTVQVAKDGAAAPMRLPSLWVMVDDALPLVEAAKAGMTCRIVNLRVVPFVKTTQREGTSFMNERPEMRWAYDGIEVTK